MMHRRPLLLLGSSVALLILAITAIVAVHVVDEPLWRHMERQLNASLTGYRVHIGAPRLGLGGSLDLLDSTIAQTAHPKPPLAYVPRLHASVARPG
jgi:hypothetical protein